MSTEAKPAEKKSYKDTLNLPQTAFPMEAKLVANEPLRLKRWQAENLYKRLLTARADSPKGKWVLHDGPPFANGDIHIGHVINKVLKDVIIRSRTMEGYQTPYVPGWDCHGLPIEHKIQEKFKGKLREMSTVEVRKHCYEYAEHFAKVQSEQFQRLGILGEWDDPYLTMRREYEASTLEVFAKFVENGLVYKQLKPVPWSVSNQTALADAELEYQDVEDASVYVEFPALDPVRVHEAFSGGMGKSAATVAFLVWTTTPWTLPANLAIAIGPEVEYALVAYGDRAVVVAKELVEAVFKLRPDTPHDVVTTVKGEALLGLEYRHPFVDGRVGRIVHADYVTTTDGTGLVHTAPGHGEEDYETGVREGLECYSPVLANGRFDETAPEFVRGLSVWEGNPVITQKLKDLGALFAELKIRHSYPHDWRSKKPIIFRATEQWFIAIDKPFVLAEELSAEAASPQGMSLRARTQRAAEREIRFVPEWGQARLGGMVSSRPDWCVSRQRAWGLPIPVFYNEQGAPLLSKESVLAVSHRFREHGSDAWFTLSPTELLGHDFPYPPGSEPEKLRKEQDIFDVWFESGSSWHAVLQARSYLGFPADLYLEGSDQHRGWFQLSLLPSIGFNGVAPFKAVLTHGFIVNPDGKKVSKSDKEYVTATQEIERHGADLLRLWCCSVDYQYDIRSSPQVIREFGEKYRKLRNTLRYLLSNLYDFNPATDAQDVPPSSLDGWVLAELDKTVATVLAAYDRYELHNVFKALYEFCNTQISAVYGNAMKDRLYCEAADSPLRRRCQTVMHEMVVALTKLLAPMIVFTADEAWEFIQHKPKDDAHAESVHLALFPTVTRPAPDESQEQEWRLVMELRDQALLQLDKLKKEAGLNKAIDAEVIYSVDDADLLRRLELYGTDLADLVGAGFHSFAEKDTPGPAVTVKVVDRRETYATCARSWKRRPDVGADPEFPDLCLRDAIAVKSARK
jgi:isoleucyl-tRNA synthetase